MSLGTVPKRSKMMYFPIMGAVAALPPADPRACWSATSTLSSRFHILPLYHRSMHIARQGLGGWSSAANGTETHARCVG